MSVRFRSDRNWWLVDHVWPDGLRTKLNKIPDEKTANRIQNKIDVACCDENRIWRKLRVELRLEGGQLQGFSDFADFYFQQYVNSHNRAANSKKSRLGILKDHFKQQPLDSITPQHIDSFIMARCKEVKNATVNRDLSVLRHMMTWAVKRDWLESNPVNRVEFLEEVEWVGERPDEAVIDKIMAKFTPALFPVFSFLRETGARRGEAMTLSPSQIDFKRAVVTFHSSTKNGKSRQVPLTDEALVAVTAMPTISGVGLVFYNPDLLQPWSGDGIDWRWEKAREQVKLGEGEDAPHSQLRLHDLRHAYGIKLAEEGCPMHYISEVMGHYSIDFTRQHYAKFSPESASRAVLKVLQGRKTAQDA